MENHNYVKKKLTKLVTVIFTYIYLTSCSNPEKVLPKGTLTGNNWFVEKGNPNTIYETSIWLKFQGGNSSMPNNTVEAWEGGNSTKSCECDKGQYKINETRNQIIISGLINKNCPWMSTLNGTYIYYYDKSRDGYNKFMFRKENLTITHSFSQNR
jgi:hypothetical protein